MRSGKWVKFWNDRSKYVEENVKYANGRGSCPDNVFNSIYKDIIKVLNIDHRSSLLDVGGGTGYFLQKIIKECSPVKTCLVDSSQNSIDSFNSWRDSNSIANSEAHKMTLPEFKIDNKRFNKIMCGTTLGYLNSWDEVIMSLQSMYDLLETDGDLLLFHHYTSDFESNAWWKDEMILFNNSKMLEAVKKVGFLDFKEVSIGDYHGSGCCGESEFSVLLKK